MRKSFKSVLKSSKREFMEGFKAYPNKIIKQMRSSYQSGLNAPTKYIASGRRAASRFGKTRGSK